MLAGLLFGIAACAIWGLIYIIPILLPEYSPILISSVRYTIYRFLDPLFITAVW